jgi:hypothetical protein
MNRYLNPPISHEEDVVVTELTGGRLHGQDMLLESFENIDNTLVTHSGQVNIDS